MNYYLKKRLSKHIKRTDMASMLGVNYSFYLAVEKGEIKMPLNLIGKFNEIINRGKENEITEAENTVKAEEFWKEVSQKDENGRWVLSNKMNSFNINNYKELVHLLGYKSTGTVYNYLEGRNPVGIEFKKKLYNFFSNEMNIQIPKKEKVKRNRTYKIGNTPRNANVELDKYYEKTDFKELMKLNNITNVQIANAVGVHNSTISNATTKKYKPSYKTIALLKEYFDNNVNNNGIVVKTTVNMSDYISKKEMLDSCEAEILEYKNEIENLNARIIELNDKIKLNNKLIEIISNK